MLLSNIKSEIIDQFDFWGRLLANGADIAKRKAINAGVRHGAGLAASVVPPAEVAVQIGLAVWTAGDAASGIFSLVGSYNELSNIKNLFESQLNRLEQIAQDAKDNPQKAMAELMTIIATINGCVRNRRCMLIPYSATKNPAQTLRGEGCCPGQTGHHVMPESMFKGSNCTPSYNGRNAPTICLEGVNNSHGSHGAAHSALKSQLKDITDKISYPDARDYAVKAVMRVAPQCSKKCFEEQLDTYHSGCDKKTGFGGLLDEKHLAPSDGTKAKTTTYTF